MRLFKVIFLLLVFFNAGFVYAEEITDFRAEYQINPDGTVAVVETINYDFGADYKHGIFRTLLTEHPQPATAWYKERSIDITIQAVEQDGTPAKFEVNESNQEVEVKIGDADQTISGSHTYTLRYLLRGALSYGPSGSEFYYDVTGTNWPVAIATATAVVKTAKTASLAELADCYVGPVGAVVACPKIDRDHQQVTFLATSLGPNEGLTIAQSVEVGSVSVLINERLPNWPVFLGLLFTYLVGGVIYIYRFRREFNPNSPVIAEYEPYPGLLPMFTGTFYDGRLDPKDITAGLVYLAEQGFLKIRKTERKVMFLFEIDDYELTLKKPLSEVPTATLKTVVELLFDTGQAGETITLSQLKRNYSKRSVNSQKLQVLKAAVTLDLKDRGFYEGLPKQGYVQLLIATTLFVTLGWFLLTSELAVLLTGLIGVVTVLLIVFGYRRLTSQGYQVRNHLLGFMEFLSVTETERYKFHNAPEKSPEQFMAFLPYAIAFGVEKKWAKVFADITIPTPDWYESGSTGLFSATALSSDLGAFASSFSASSGTSASSGGGSSGGGGGGGGGGSW